MIYKEIEHTADKDMLYKYLVEAELDTIETVLRAYSEGKIDIIEPRDENGEPDFDGEFELIINDENYVETGFEAPILKWINDWESTDYIIELFSDQEEIK